MNSGPSLVAVKVDENKEETVIADRSGRAGEL